MRLWLVALLLWGATTNASATEPNPDQQFAAITQAEWQWRLQQFPQLALGIGQPAGAGLGKVDVKTQRTRQRYWENVNRQLAEIDPNALSKANQINFTIYQAQIRNRIDAIRLKAYLIPMTSDSSYFADLPSLSEQHPFETEVDYVAYLDRLRDIPRYFAEHQALLEQGLSIGMTLPQVVLKGRDVPLLQVLKNADDVEKIAYFKPFVDMPERIQAARATQLRDDAKTALRDDVIPAYQALLDYLNTRYIPGARQTLGASKLPDGAAYYQLQIREYTTLDSDAESIHQIGLKEVTRIRAEMEQVQVEAGFTGSFAEFIDFLRTDPQFYAQTPRELIMAASYIAKKIDGVLPQFFSTLPRQPYGVVPVPERLAPFYTSGRYSGAPIDGRNAGFYWVNTYALASRPLYALPALTLHEAVPGHHLQIALAGEQGSQPPFRRYDYISAFGEGWALYAEHLGVEMGIYETPYEHFGRLTYEMWRACRLVIDTGIHAKGWTREQALALLRDNTALSELEITNEIDRYISWPGQALAYKLGELMIRELRAEAEKTLGAEFDLRWFHDQVLQLGSVPLPILEREVRRAIAAKSSTKGG